MRLQQLEVVRGGVEAGCGQSSTECRGEQLNSNIIESSSTECRGEQLNSNIMESSSTECRGEQLNSNIMKSSSTECRGEQLYRMSWGAATVLLWEGGGRHQVGECIRGMSLERRGCDIVLSDNIMDSSFIVVSRGAAQQ